MKTRVPHRVHWWLCWLELKSMISPRENPIGLGILSQLCGVMGFKTFRTCGSWFFECVRPIIICPITLVRKIWLFFRIAPGGSTPFIITRALNVRLRRVKNEMNDHSWWTCRIISKSQSSCDPKSPIYPDLSKDDILSTQPIPHRVQVWTRRLG